MCATSVSRVSIYWWPWRYSQIHWLTFMAWIKRPWRFPAIFLWSVFSQRTGKAALFPTHSQRRYINAVLQCGHHNAQSGSCRVIVRASAALCCNITPNKWCWFILSYITASVCSCPSSILHFVFVTILNTNKSVFPLFLQYSDQRKNNQLKR